VSREQEYFDVLRKIAREYQPSEWFEDHAEEEYGCAGDEALAMAYDNIQTEAANAIRGRQRPKS
jgi:hypothetical protein